MRSFKSLTEQEILALAIALEEEDARIYSDFAEGLRQNYPATAKILDEMREEEDGHRHRLIELHRRRYGEHIPLVRRQDIKGFVQRRPVWLVRPLGLAAVRRQVEIMELETKRFYESAIRQTTDAGIRQLLGDLAEEERRHARLAEELESAERTSGALDEEAATRNRLFVMQVIQPGLAGLMDGSVSTLAPLFAAAFATRNSHDTFAVGLAASLGAGISMGFAEALSDDGVLTGRGRPLMRGLVCGLMTALGGLGHTLPYLIGNYRTATTIAAVIVFVELAVISWIRHHFMDTAAHLRRVSSHGRRIPRLSHRHLDREFLNGVLGRSAAMRYDDDDNLGCSLAPLAVLVAVTLSFLTPFFVATFACLTAIWSAVGNSSAQRRIFVALLPGVLFGLFAFAQTGPSFVYRFGMFLFIVLIVPVVALPSAILRAIGFRLVRLTSPPTPAEFPTPLPPLRSSLRQLLLLASIAAVMAVLTSFLRPEKEIGHFSS